jgi:hypothetical protein
VFSVALIRYLVVLLAHQEQDPYITFMTQPGHDLAGEEARVLQPPDSVPPPAVEPADP